MRKSFQLLAISLNKLKIWEKGIQIATETYKLTKGFPSDEKFDITSQLNRASISIASNIAEGSSRHSEKDYYGFLKLHLDPFLK